MNFDVVYYTTVSLVHVRCLPPVELLHDLAQSTAVFPSVNRLCTLEFPEVTTPRFLINTPPWMQNIRKKLEPIKFGIYIYHIPYMSHAATTDTHTSFQSYHDS